MISSIFDRLHILGVIPVIEIDSVDRAASLAEALLRGGLPVAEVTLRTGASVAAIRSIASGFDEILIGAGTVLDRVQAARAMDAGAQFLVCPGMIEEVILWAQDNRVPMLAGAATPTEIIRGINLGLDILKFFPADTLGGLKALQAMSDPFPQLRFIPTGGIRLENAAEYLRNSKIHAVGGSWVAKRTWIAEGRFEEIAQQARQAAALVKEIRG